MFFQRINLYINSKTLKSKLSLNNRFIFSFIVTIYLISNTFNSSASSHKILSFLSSEIYPSTALTKFQFSQSENSFFLKSDIVADHSANFSILTILNSSINSGAVLPESKTPIETNLIPFLMMSLGFVLWKVHKRSMKKNDK